MPSPKSKSKDFFDLSKKKQVDVLIEWILLQAFITYISMRKAAGAKKPRAKVGRTISLFGAAVTRASRGKNGKNTPAAKKSTTAKKSTAAKKSAAAKDMAETDHIIKRLINVVKASPTAVVTVGSRAMQHAGSSGTLTYKNIVEILKKDKGIRDAVGDAVECIKDSLKKTKHTVTENSERAREGVVTLTRVMETISNSDPQLGRWAYETMTPPMRAVNDMIGVGGSLVKQTSGATVRIGTHYLAPGAAGIGALGISWHLAWTLIPKIHNLVRANSSVSIMAATGAAFIYQDNAYGPEARQIVENTIQRGGEILSNALLIKATGLVAPYATPRGSPQGRGFWAIRN